MSESRGQKTNQYYDEYVSRRNKEMLERESKLRAVEEEKRKEAEQKQRIARRARSSNGRPSSRNRTGSSRKNTEKFDKRQSYEMESHQYKPSGFETMNSELGEDPITALRTMKNRLRKMAVSSTLNDRQIKTHLCQQACEELSKAEGELERLQRKRTDMLIRGDTRPAEEISKQMNDIRNRAMHTAYIDLVMDKPQSAAFGVKSKWVPPNEDTSEDEEKIFKPPTPIRYKRKDDDMISVKSLNTRRKEREQRAETSKSSLSKRPDSATFKRPLKKNVRLFEFDTGQKSTDPNDPFGLMENAPTACQFCGESNTDFSRESLLKSHWAENCPVLTKCDFCDIVVETAVLNEHQLLRCKFVGKSLQPCELCGLACYQGEPNHPRCRRTLPPDDSVWCPLCSIAVSPNDSSEAWKKHLTETCYNNPRKYKSGVPDVNTKIGGVDDDDLLSAIDKITNDWSKPIEEPRTNNIINSNQPVDPNQLPPGSVVYQSNGLTPEDIKAAFARIRDERKKQNSEMRQKEDEKEKQEEIKAQQDAKKVQDEIDKIKKEKEAKAAAKKTKKSS